MQKSITASILYNLVQCPHRVTMDIFGDSILKDPVNPFVQLLWDRGNAFEQEVIEGLNRPFTNLKAYSSEEKERLTIEAMKQGNELIYGGRIRVDDLVGEPDILRRCDPGYMAGDIKSGAGEEGASEDTDGKPKKHYAVQLALYTDILEHLGFSGGRKPFVWDVHGQEVIYDLNAPQGVRKPDSLWNEYQATLENARNIVTKKETTLPAYAGICKLCHWYTACKKSLEDSDDLTLIPELGRSKRDVLISQIGCRRVLASADLGAFIEGKKTSFPGIGPETLLKLQERARLQREPGARPYLKEPVTLSHFDCELHFDVETDPMRDICYLHGFLEHRKGSATDKYVAFFAENPTEDEEKQAFDDALAYVRKNSPCVIYYYSPYERVIWNKLQVKYPDIVSEEEVRAVFDPSRAIDLYHHVVRPKTVWPTYDHSIKTLATHLGFFWRDPNPSGAASIEWYHRWTESKDYTIRQRIFEYNEDDCMAMRVLLDGIRKMSQY